MTPVLAHAGHWALSLLYAAPVAVLAAWMGIAGWRERRRDGDADRRRR